MKLRDLLLAACLLACPLCGNQPGAAAPPPRPAVVTPPEPHPAPAAAPAGPAVYNVEVIVFRTNAALGSPENWAAEAARAPAVPVAADGETGAASDAATSTGGTPVPVSGQVASCGC